MRNEPNSVALLLAVSLAAFCQEPPPNLSGIWRANPEKGKYSHKAPEYMAVKIEQNGDQIDMSLRVRNDGNEENQTFHYTIGSDDNRNSMHGAPMQSKVHWEGRTLVEESVATFGSKDLHMRDRWTLAGDGQTLRFVEGHQFGGEPAAEEDMVFERQPDNSWQPDPQPKPAEEVFKNIQVMKGMPSTRLMPVMNLFTKSLGVECGFCHLSGQFSSDDKPAKQTARKMVRMVSAINDGNFADTRAVSCWTCHRGSSKPAAPPQ